MNTTPMVKNNTYLTENCHFIMPKAILKHNSCIHVKLDIKMLLYNKIPVTDVIFLQNIISKKKVAR